MGNTNMNRKNRLQALGAGAAALVASSASSWALRAQGESHRPPAAQLILVSIRSGIVNGTPNGNEI